jgi:hypothetical protein
MLSPARAQLRIPTAEVHDTRVGVEKPRHLGRLKVQR